MPNTGIYSCFDDEWVKQNYAKYERNKDLWAAYLETHECKYSYNSFRAYLVSTLGLRREWTSEMTEFLAPHYSEWGAKRSQEELVKKFGVLKSVHCIHHNMSDSNVHVTKDAKAKILSDSQSTKEPVGTVRFHNMHQASKTKDPYYAMIKTENGWEPYGKIITNNDDPDLIAIPLDMNQQNLDPENWVLIPKKLTGTMGRLGLWSTDPELNRTSLKLCELVQAFTQQNKKEKQNEPNNSSCR